MANGDLAPPTDALLEGEVHHESAEFKRRAHPDRLADRIAMEAGGRLLGIDPAARFDIQAVVHFGPLSISLPERSQPVSAGHSPLVFLCGQIATKAKPSQYLPLVEEAARRAFAEVGYGKESGISRREIAVIASFNSQSEQIIAGIRKGGGLEGAGDATIVYGYASSQTRESFNASQALAWHLSNLLDRSFEALAVPALLPDGKVQVDVAFGGCYNSFPVKPLRAENVVVAVQHRPLSRQAFGRFTDRIVGIVRSLNSLVLSPSGKPLNLVDRRTEIVVDGAGQFTKGGVLADSGANGRMDSLYVSGSTRRYGGGLLVGRDVTKTDFSCQLIARNIALHLVKGGIAREAAVTITYAIGQTAPSSFSVLAEGCDYSSEHLVEAINRAFDLSPRGIMEHLKVSGRDFLAIARDGFFGVKPNGSHRWEKVSRQKLEILHAHLKKCPKIARPESRAPIGAKIRA